MSLDAYTPVEPAVYRLVKQTPCRCGSRWCDPDEEELRRGTWEEVRAHKHEFPAGVMQQLTEWTSRKWKNL